MDRTRFVIESAPQRVVFGDGALDRLGEELQALGVRQALLLCTPPQRPLAQEVARRLGPLAAGIFDGAVMHVPVEVARQARQAAADCGADGAVALGGGSTIGLGKAIALESGLPILAVPTTYAGSEMTPIYGLTEAGHKRTGRDPRVLPRTVIYDPALTLALPLDMSTASGLNAIAHAAEGLYAQDAQPLSDWMATEGIAALGRALPRLCQRPGDPQARADALYGSWLCGKVLGSVGMGLHHQLCHALGGSFNLPHAQTHAIVLPHALAYNAGAAPQAMAAIANALGAAPDTTAAQAVHDLAGQLRVPMSLREIGLRADQLDTACEIALQRHYPNPRPLESAGLRELLADAFEGRRPG